MIYVTYTNDREFSNGLGQLTTSAKKVDMLCHSLIVAALALAAPGNGGDRNVDRLRRVFERFPKGSRLEAAKHAAKEYAPITVATKKDGKLSVKLRKDAPSDWIMNPDPAEHVPFWELTKEKNPAPFDFRNAVKSLMNNLQKGIDGKRPMKGDTEHAERLLHGLEAVTADVFEA